MFLGTHTPKLDEKGRIILPAKFREELSGGVVLARGQERCVYVFSRPTFQEKVEAITKAPLTSRAARDYVRMFLSGASDEVPDKQHRVTVPAALRDYAGLGRDLTVIGAGDRAEIWATEAWEAYYAEKEEAFSSTEEEVIPGLF
ncbi:division/cell wall cluster transcriptional repressor MraZ [Microcella daejeonensis]|uniref:Transcriptional regulator MraZ n=1 Tax=Microcella daejeonensis TaxID=2994971 RepID=A0A9E8MKU5_9MICO|nr:MULTISPECIES: division/cell wall cluster transcriptional repressor MraZ [Microcella]WAB81371.1 division/cell wall cluster transcriptional repressor MraZ [Microcella daejeonensis]WAB83537.1 division/cell wall cluster transcriptional repressor MraZ [Microcella daejeonensis]